VGSRSRSRGPEGREVTEQVKLDKLESGGNLLEWGGHEYVICRLLIKAGEEKEGFFGMCGRFESGKKYIYRGVEFRNVKKEKNLGFTVSHPPSALQGRSIV
jgi:hypothetical protein